MARRKGTPVGDEDRLLSVPEVAERLGVSAETVRRYLRSGRLRGVLLGGRGSAYRIAPAELRRFLTGGQAERQGEGERPRVAEAA
jgi:excisionase family DNA binding protein